MLRVSEKVLNSLQRTATAIIEVQVNVTLTVYLTVYVAIVQVYTTSRFSITIITGIHQSVPLAQALDQLCYHTQ